MANWVLPSITTSLYTDVLTILKARDVDAMTLGKDALTNAPTGAIVYSRTNNRFEEYNGATYDAKTLALTGGGTGGSTAATARTSLGLGSLAVQDANTVAITGGSINGVSLDASGFTTGTVAIARGGTGASLSLGASGTFLRSNGSAVEFSTVGTALTALNASNIGSGTVPVARLSGITVTQLASPNVSQFTNDAGYVTAATASVPIGAMIDYGGSSAPTSWLLCDGSAISRATYAALFAIIGTAFGVGDGVNTFNLPDFRDRSSLGVYSYGLGTKIGTLAHAHAVGSLANTGVGDHTHGISGTTGSESDHTHDVKGNTGNTNLNAHSHSFTTSEEEVSLNTTNMNEGDGSNGSVDVGTSLTGGLHDHNGTTGGPSDTTHLHAVDIPTGGGSSHSHVGGSLAAANAGSHGHPITGNTDTNIHACLVVNKIIKYQ